MQNLYPEVKLLVYKTDITAKTRPKQKIEMSVKWVLV